MEDTFKDPAKAAGEEAKRLHKLAFPESYSEEAPKEPAPPEEEPLKEEAPPSETEIPAESPQTPPDKAPPPKREDTPEYWRDRFEVMQGKYNSEVPRMADQIRELTDQIRTLMAANQHPAKAPEKKADPVDEVMGRIAETYGEELARDFLELAKATSATAAKESLQPMEKELEQIKTTSSRTAQQSFEDALTSRVSNWRQVYADPAFADFLRTNIEPFTGATYEVLFSVANQNWDLERIAHFFSKFIELKQPPTQNPETPQIKPQVPEHLITPARRGGGVQTQMENAKGQIYTRQQINDFYKEVLDGKYRGQDAKIRQTKAEFHKAAMEGRVVG